MQPPFNNFAYPGGYMQGGYPMASFPPGQPGMAPMPFQPAPVPSGVSQPVQPPAAAPQSQSAAPQLTAQVGHISPTSSDAGSPGTGEATRDFVPIAPKHSIEQDDHHEEEH
eukprot:1615160-Rhodomonas_salina.1